MKRKEYFEPEMELLVLAPSLNLLHGLSADAYIEDYQDGGDLGDTADGTGTSTNY